MPDVTWHPVDETPPRGLRPLYLHDTQEGVLIGSATYFPDLIGPRFIDFDFRWLRHVTHWAHIAYPEPPEEA